MRIFLTLLLVVSFLTGNAAPKKIKLASSKAPWKLTASWDLGRLPQDGDTVIIAKGDTVVINDNFAGLKTSTLRIEIAGVLFFEGGGAKLTIGTNSIVNILAGGFIYSDINNSQVLAIGANEVYEGTDPIVVGPAIASSTSSGFTAVAPPVTLPVTFIGFNLARKNADILVHWATAQETNASVYEIERSFDGSTWNTIASVKAAGTTNSVSNYSFTDKSVSAKTVYYRIKQKDLNGDFTYTSVKSLKADTSITVKATALRGNIVLQFAEQVKGQVEVRLVSLNGQVVSKQVFNQPVGQFVVPAYVKGNYILTVSNNQDIQLNKQILF